MRGDTNDFPLFCALSPIFNPRPSVRGDKSDRRREKARFIFNPRPSVRGDVFDFDEEWEPYIFNPRPSVRGDEINPRPHTLYRNFQSTPLREGRQAWGRI